MSRNRQVLWPFFSGVLLTTLLAACGPPGGGNSEGDALAGKVVLTGSSTIAPLMTEIAQRFEARHPRARIDVQTGGSSRGIADAGSGLADIGMSSRGLTTEEAAGLEAHTLAFDGVAFVVHGSNPVESLTDEQLLALYTGQVEDWSALGGKAGPITVVHRAAGRSEVELVAAYFGIEPEAIQADLISGENQHAIKTVAGDPNAIVYVSLGAAQRAAAEGQPVKLLPLRGIAATVEAVAATVGETYPLARPLLLLTAKGTALSPLAQAFLDFARSAENDDLIEALAYVPPPR